MKNLWKDYSYAILFLAITVIIGLMGVYRISSPVIDDTYMQVTVSEGDSLWSIAKQYDGTQSLSYDEFVSWVEKMNDIDADYIYPGEKILIPIKIKEKDVINIASSL